MPTIQFARVGRYFNNQTDYMADNLFRSLSGTDLNNRGTTAFNGIDDDNAEIKLKFDGDQSPIFEPFSVIYRYKDTNDREYTYGYPLEVKAKGTDFVIIQLRKNGGLSYYVSNTRVGNNLINTHITGIRSPFFKTGMLGIDDPLMKGVINGSTRRTTWASHNYWDINEQLPASANPYCKVHGYLRRGGRDSTNRFHSSPINNYAVFVIPSTAYGPMGTENKLGLLKNDGSAQKFVMNNFGQELVFLVPYVNSFNRDYGNAQPNNERLSIGFAPTGDGQYAFERRVSNISMFDDLLKNEVGGKYFKGFYTGVPSLCFSYSGMFRYGPASTNVTNQDPIGYVGYYFPLREPCALNGMIPDITRNQQIGGQQLGTSFYPRYYNDPQPNVYILNYMDARLNGGNVRYGSLIAGSRRATGSIYAYISDGYANQNNYTSTGIQSMQLMLGGNGRFIMSKRTNYTALTQGSSLGQGYSYFTEGPLVYFPNQLPSAFDDYQRGLSANQSQLQAAQNQANINTAIGVLTALVAGAGLLAAPVSGGASLALGGIALGGATSAVSSILKQEQINAQYRDAANSLGSSFTNVVDEGLAGTMREAQYFSGFVLSGGGLQVNFRFSDTWFVDSYEPTSANFQKLNNIIFYNGFYGNVSQPMNTRPSNIHCAFFQANDEGLKNKIIDALLKNSSSNLSHKMIKPVYVDNLVKAFESGMRLGYSNPSRIGVDLSTGQAGTNEAVYHAESTKQPLPDYALRSILIAIHNDIKGGFEDESK